MCCPLAIAALTVATWGESAGLRATRTMRHDVLRRVRWANVSLACAVLAALATLVVWPLLSAAPPPLPSDTTRPLVGREPGEPDSGPTRTREARRGAGGAETTRSGQTAHGEKTRGAETTDGTGSHG